MTTDFHVLLVYLDAALSMPLDLVKVIQEYACTYSINQWICTTKSYLGVLEGTCTIQQNTKTQWTFMLTNHNPLYCYYGIMYVTSSFNQNTIQKGELCLNRQGMLFYHRETYATLHQLSYKPQVHLYDRVTIQIDFSSSDKGRLLCAINDEPLQPVTDYFYIYKQEQWVPFIVYDPLYAGNVILIP